MAAADILYFEIVNLTIPACRQCENLRSVPNLVQISVMTSRELTSGFDLWSRGHLRMAVMHLHIKFGADIFIQSGVRHFSEIQDGGVNLAIRVC